MAIFLDPNVPRAHAAPLNPVHQGAAQLRTNPPRPDLIAHWRIAPDGRLICCWRASRSVPFPPPD